MKSQDAFVAAKIKEVNVLSKMIEEKRGRAGSLLVEIQELKLHR